MKVEAAIAMLQALPAGSEIDLVIRSIRDGAGPSSTGAKTGAQRSREYRQRVKEERLGRDGPPSRFVTDRDDRDEARDAESAGGIQGGSEISKPDQSRKEAKNTDDPGFSLTAQESRVGSETAERDVTRDGVTRDAKRRDVTPRSGRRAPSKTPMPAGFALSGEHRVYAESKSWPGWWLENRFARFVELAGAKGWVYADWKLALYAFLRAEAEEYGRGPEQLSHLAPKQAVRQPFVEQNKARMEARQRELAAELKGPAATSVQSLIAGIGGDG